MYTDDTSSYFHWKYKAVSLNIYSWCMIYKVDKTFAAYEAQRCNTKLLTYIFLLVGVRGIRTSSFFCGTGECFCSRCNLYIVVNFSYWTFLLEIKIWAREARPNKFLRFFLPIEFDIGLYWIELVRIELNFFTIELNFQQLCRCSSETASTAMSAQ